MSLIRNGSLSVKENKMILLNKKDKIINVATYFAYQMFKVIHGKEARNRNKFP